MTTKLIVFLKNPELGKVKTRIAKSCGEKEALEIYQKLIKHTLDVAKKSDLKVELCFSDRIESEELFSIHDFDKTIQIGSDLGERMHNAFVDSHNGNNESTIIIGSDCLQLTANHLKEASEALNSKDVVLGPANDGGYYLIGLKEPFEKLLKGKKWSHQNVLNDALEIIKSAGLNFHLLEKLSDIDTYDDWLSHKYLID